MGDFLTRKRLLNFCQSQSVATRLLYIDIIHRFIYIYCTRLLYYYIYHYTVIYYLVFHYMRLYYIYALMWYYTMIYYAYMLFMRLYVIIRTYRAIILCDTVILCADTFKRLCAAVRKGKCDLLSKNIQNFFK